MKNFKDILEARGDTAVFTFGRFNPPTTGHEKLIDALAKQQSKNAGSMMYVYPSHSQNPKKDPLPHALKTAYMRKMFPKYKSNIIAGKERNAIEIAVSLHKKGHKSIVMVVGSDRVSEFEKLLNKYNGVEARHGYYGFDNIEVVSAGERDPDAEGVTGMSASKMRAAASSGDFDSFKTGLPSGFGDAQKLYNDVRKNMGIREEREMGEMNDFETLRDMYLTGKLWNVGDLVEANGVEGRIIRKGTNYVAFNDNTGKVHKAWLHDIVERDYKKEYANYQGTPEQIARRSSRNQARRVMGDKAIQGMDVGHKDNNPMNNDPSNLKNEDPSLNRREPRLREVKQDPDIKKSKGTEPAKYYAKDAKGKDMAVSTKKARDTHFTKGAKMDDDNPAAYKQAPGDKGKKTKPSTHTKKFKQMYGESSLNEKRAKQAVAGGKVQKLVTAFGYSFKGKNYKEIDMELVGIDNSNQIVTFKIIHPKEIFGNEMKIPFKTLRRGRYMATDTSKIDEGRARDRLAKIVDKASGRTMTDRQRDAAAATASRKAAEKDLASFRKKQRMKEVLGKNADMGDYIDDFKKSDAPQFKGKSDKKIKDMAIAAYLSKNESVLDFTLETLNEDGHTDVASMKNKVQIAMNALQKMEMELNKIGDENDLPTWWTNKVATAVARLDDMADYLDVKVDESLWANIHKKRQRIKQGSGEKMRKPGTKGAPTPTQLKRAKGEEVSEKAPNTRDAMKRFKAGDAGFTDKAHLKAKGLIPRADGTKKKSPQYEEVQDAYHLDEKIAGLVKKAEKSGMPYGILKKVYDRGMAAWRTGHRPGTTPQQWAFARVNSFTTKSSGTWGKADKDLAKQVRGESVELKNAWGEITEAAEYQGRKVQLNNPTKGDVKKYKVYVRNDKGNVVKVEFGDPNMQIKRDDPARRKAFRARHNCDTKKDKTTAGYWSCKFWSSKSVTDLMKG